VKPPWIQLSADLEEAVADVAIITGRPESELGWGLYRVYRWILARAPDDRPPSASAVVYGTRPGSGPVPARIQTDSVAIAARLIVGAGRIQCEPMAFVEACTSIPKPLMDLVPWGIRLRGLDRYDPLWGKNRPKEWAEWKRKYPKGFVVPPVPVDAAALPYLSGAAAEPVRNRPGTEPVPSPSRAGPVAQPARDRAQTGPQDIDVDVDLDSSTDRPTFERTGRKRAPPEQSGRSVGGKEELQLTFPTEPNRAEVELEGHEPRFADLLEMANAWQDARAEFDLPAEDLDEPTLAKAERFRTAYAAAQWAGAFRNYLDPEQSRGARWAVRERNRWPLAILLDPAVLAKKMPSRPPQRLLCLHCRAPATEIRDPAGKPICYPCFAKHHAAPLTDEGDLAS
jgi:hypothetical protein